MGNPTDGAASHPPQKIKSLQKLEFVSKQLSCSGWQQRENLNLGVFHQDFKLLEHLIEISKNACYVSALGWVLGMCGNPELTRSGGKTSST